MADREKFHRGDKILTEHASAEFGRGSDTAMRCEIFSFVGRDRRTEGALDVKPVDSRRKAARDGVEAWMLAALPKKDWGGGRGAE